MYTILFFLPLQDEKARLEEAIARLSSGFDVEGGEEDERMVAIKQHLQADREKLTKIRALLVRLGKKHPS